MISRTCTSTCNERHPDILLSFMWDVPPRVIRGSRGRRLRITRCWTFGTRRLAYWIVGSPYPEGRGHPLDTGKAHAGCQVWISDTVLEPDGPLKAATNALDESHHVVGAEIGWIPIPPNFRGIQVTRNNTSVLTQGHQHQFTDVQGITSDLVVESGDGAIAKDIHITPVSIENIPGFTPILNAVVLHEEETDYEHLHKLFQEWQAIW